jgi:hypothetical protein
LSTFDLNLDFIEIVFSGIAPFFANFLVFNTFNSFVSLLWCEHTFFLISRISGIAAVVNGRISQEVGIQQVLLHNVAAHNLNVTGRVCYLT